MAVGSLAMTCLWLALGQAPADVLHTNQRNHGIPVNFQQEAKRGDISELRLFASSDQGRTWQQVGSITPDKAAFTFYAPGDGIYWLRVAVVNRQGQQVPENLSAEPPDQQMVIDTLKPVINTFQARQQGDEIYVSWDLQEQHPDASSFRIEYQPTGSAGTSWLPVPAQPGMIGQTKFRPGSPAPLTLRLGLRDQAGNQSFAFAEIPGNGTVAAAFSNPGNTAVPPSTPGGNAPPAFNAAPSLPTEIAVPRSAPDPIAPQVASSAPPPPAPPVVKDNLFHKTLSQAPIEHPTTLQAQAPQPAPTPATLTSGQNTGAPAPPPVPHQGPPVVAPPAEKVVADSTWAPPAPVVPVTGNPGSGLTSGPEAGPPAPGPSTAPTPPEPRRKLPALQYVNNPEVTLEFELSKVGPSGVGSIDLWLTENDGETWKRFAYEDKPHLIAAKGRQQRTITLSKDGTVKDGIYGFTLVVKSRAGLGKALPKAGDAPEIRLELDTKEPLAKLIAPSPDRSRSNALLLKWIAEDKNLAKTPICLEWAEKRDGEWLTIAKDLANDGQYSWQLPERMPVQVYLRLRVRDAAGNESIAITPEPQLVDLTEPEGHLINVSAPPRR